MEVLVEAVIKCPKSFGAVMYLEICEDCELFGGIDATGEKKYVNCGLQADIPQKLYNNAEMAHFMILSDKCPDCEGKLEWGPKGGLAQNCACTGCRNRYNVTPLGVERYGKVVFDPEGNIRW